ncbi:C40 family peptidase [Streptomyces fuscigenes]|uniref:C40 family peptidase n=1 Tax=Streptomyces fuscigenes TaxID=1528880 RepID=UPI001F1BB137|nr:C40 family peptidase [Streptomyces fuscigenes]MCF3961125.1 C40 family peptidase [Streptomyces fuscigenes]
MPAMASHRKPRSTTLVRAGSPAVGITTAALASVTLLGTGSGTATAAGTTRAAATAPAVRPGPSIADVQRQVDDLYRQAGSATEDYDQAKESTADQRKALDSLLDDIARRTDRMNESRRRLGMFATAQYRQGAVSPTAALIFADSPQSYFDETQLMDRMSDRQSGALADFQGQQAAAAKKRAQAAKQLQSLTASQARLRASKQQIQQKLGDAQAMLSKLTAQEKARLAALEKKKQAEADAKAKAKAAEEARARAAAEKRRQQAQAQDHDQAPQKTTTGTTTPPAGTTTSPGSSAKADQALAFARAQIGKPYVWGATGPGSFDCSGLTQAAWKAAGVDLPRTTYDQVNAGTRVATADLRPGDLVFFFSDISHVGMYIGDGMMIHAPKPGAYVREESIYTMPIYASVRPA